MQKNKSKAPYVPHLFVDFPRWKDILRTSAVFKSLTLRTCKFKREYQELRIGNKLVNDIKTFICGHFPPPPAGEYKTVNGSYRWIILFRGFVCTLVILQ